MKRSSVIAVFVLFTLACDGDNVVPTTPSTPVVPAPTSQGVSLSPVVQSIPPGQTVRLTATARFSDGTTRDVTSQAIWTSFQTSVATVSAGAVTGVALGRALIQANFERWFTSMTILIKPDGTFILTGKVTEPGGVGVGGALVEVTEGPPSRASTRSDGFYELFGVSGTVFVRYGKADYFDERRSVTILANQSLDVEITPRSAPMNLAGTYRVTVTVPMSCTILPSELRTRTYTARIDQDRARLMVTLSGASFVSMKNTFLGSVSGNTVRFDLGGTDYYYYYYYGDGAVQEVLSTGQILGLHGTMIAPATPQSISGPFQGGFILRTGNSSRSCGSSGSQMVFTRQ